MCWFSKPSFEPKFAFNVEQISAGQVTKVSLPPAKTPPLALRVPPILSGRY